MKTLIIVIIIIFSCALLFQDDILQEIKLKWRASEKERMEAEGDYWVLWNEYSEAKKYSKLLNISINVRDVEIKELQKEVNQWKIRAKKRNEKVKILPAVPKIPILIEVIPKVIPGVVHVSCPQWQGSGFIISEHLIATARHVTEGITEFEITFNDGTVLNATRAISSKDHDVAFIWIDEPMPTPVVLGSIKDCKLGQAIFAIGSPYGKINYNSVTLGIISGLNRDYDELNDGMYESVDYGWDVAFQTDAPGHPGNSGGPIFTLDGKVRGVLVGGFSPSLIIAMPVDLFIKDIEMIELMFLQDAYYHEKTVVYEYNQYNMPVGPGLGE